MPLDLSFSEAPCGRAELVRFYVNIKDMLFRPSQLAIPGTHGASPY